MLSWRRFAATTGADRGIVAVAPHPDDETLGCGGLLALATRAGAPVTVAYLTDGNASHPGSRDWPPARLAALRREEARRACHVLGVSRAPVFLGLPDGGTLAITDEARDRATATLARLLATQRPGLVVTTSRGEPHCDHQAAFALATAALRAAEHEAPLAAYVVWTDLLGGEPPTGTPLTLRLGPTAATKRRALAAHRSQLEQVVRDDPNGFALEARHREAMLGPTERYWVQP